MNKVITDKNPVVDWRSLADKLATRVEAELAAPGELQTERLVALTAFINAFSQARATAIAIARATATATATATSSVNIDLDNDNPDLEARCVFVRTERTLLALSRSSEWKSFTFQAPIIEVISKCGGILAYSRTEAVFFRCLDGVFVPTPGFAVQPLPDQLQTDGQPVTDGEVTCWAA